MMPFNNTSESIGYVETVSKYRFSTPFDECHRGAAGVLLLSLEQHYWFIPLLKKKKKRTPTTTPIWQ
jgi:hypothetical protein